MKDVCHNIGVKLTLDLIRGANTIMAEHYSTIQFMKNDYIVDNEKEKPRGK